MTDALTAAPRPSALVDPPDDVTDVLLWRLADAVTAAHQPDPSQPDRCSSLLCTGEAYPCPPARTARRAQHASRIPRRQQAVYPPPTWSPSAAATPPPPWPPCPPAAPHARPDAQPAREPAAARYNQQPAAASATWYLLGPPPLDPTPEAVPSLVRAWPPPPRRPAGQLAA